VASCEKQKASDVSKLVGKTVGLQFGHVERTHNEQCPPYQRRQWVTINFDHTLYVWVTSSLPASTVPLLGPPNLPFWGYRRRFHCSYAGCLEFAQVFGRFAVISGTVLNCRDAVADPTPERHFCFVYLENWTEFNYFLPLINSIVPMCSHGKARGKNTLTSWHY
jgi:hypothetical protein